MNNIKKHTLINFKGKVYFHINFQIKREVFGSKKQIMRANDVEEKSCNLHKRMKEKVKVNIIKKKIECTISTFHAFMTSGAKNMTAEKLENGEK